MFMTRESSAPLPFVGYVRAKSIALYCDVSVALVRGSWIKQPDFPSPTRVGSRCVLWSAEEVLAWLRKHQIKKDVSSSESETKTLSSEEKAAAMRRLIAARKDADFYRWLPKSDCKEVSP